MPKYLIDTNILVDLLRNNLSVDKFMSSGNLAVSTITLSELYYGAEKTSNPEKSFRLISGLVNDLGLKVLSFDHKPCKLFANIKAKLEKKGEKIEDFDIMIASTAIENDRILITGNLKHFDRIEGLKLWKK